VFELNGAVIWEGSSPFANEIGDWLQVDLTVPPDAFQAGDNVLTVNYDPPSGREGRDAVLALGDVEVLTADEAESESGNSTEPPADTEDQETEDQPDAAPTIAPRSHTDGP
jgi:hypothetical protein